MLQRPIGKAKICFQAFSRCSSPASSEVSSATKSGSPSRHQRKKTKLWTDTVPSLSSRSTISWSEESSPRSSIPLPAILDRSLLRGIIDVNQAEAAGVAEGPFEVVHQGPGKIALERSTRVDRRARRCQVPGVVRGPERVGDPSIDRCLVRISRAILGDVKRTGGVVTSEPH